MVRKSNYNSHYYFSDLLKDITIFNPILSYLGISETIDSIIGQDGLIHIILSYPVGDGGFRVTDAIEYFNTEVGCNEYFTLSGFDYNEILRKLNYISVCYIFGTIERWH